MQQSWAHLRHPELSARSCRYYQLDVCPSDFLRNWKTVMVAIKKGGSLAKDQMGLADLRSQITSGEWLALLPSQVLHFPPPQCSPHLTAILSEGLIAFLNFLRHRHCHLIPKHQDQEWHSCCQEEPRPHRPCSLRIGLQS
jgi:hypothetical protein